MAYELKTLCINDFCRSVLEYVQGQNIEFTKVGGKVTISADLSDYLTAEQIYDLIGEIGGISMQKVDVLPPTGESNVIYLVPKNPGEQDNIFDEYVYVDGDWEKIGDTSVDLSDYYTKSETDALIPTKTSDLTNDSDFVSDANYVHTDNNFTSADKTKLNGIASGAQVNQNAFSAVKVGAQTIYADTTTDTVELEAGANVILTVDTANDKITIEARDTTYGEVTTTTAGLMSPNDLVKLDSIEFGATVDDKTWDGVQLDNSQVVNNAGTTYVPHTIGSVTSATANMTEASATPSGAVIAKWDTNSQLHSASPLIADTPSDVVATTEYVINQVSGKANVADIPTATSQLTNDSNFVSDANYVHTDNNFTTADKTKLDGIEDNAEVNVQSDWNQTDTTADDYIKNKPTIPTGGAVTGVKGNEETSYRTGDVNLTPQNIGAVASSDLVDLIYPVGSIYMSVNSTNPQTLFGGTWVALEDRFLIGASSTYAGGSKDGDATVTLTEANLPSHHHSYTKPPTATGSHTLTTTEIPAHTHGSKTLTGDAQTYSDMGMLGAKGSATGIFSKGTLVKNNVGAQWRTDYASYKLHVNATHTHDSVGGSGGHTHTITNTSDSTGNTGSGTAVNNMPPYLAVYMWKRTA